MSRNEKYERYLEARAESLGLPTNPEAYQDGGLAEVATAATVSEADTLVALLRASDVPAWVKAPLSALAGAESQAVFPVLVPLGRLADAQRLIAEKGGPHEVPAEGEPEEEPEDETPAAPSHRPLLRTLISIAILVIGLLGVALAIAIFIEVRVVRNFDDLQGLIFSILTGLAGIGLCILAASSLWPRRAR